MDSTNILMWMMGGQAALILFIWNRIEIRFTLLQETVTDIDRRLCRLEGAFASKDFRCRVIQEKFEELINRIDKKN